MTEQTFTPATGRFALTGLYDSMTLLTRERLWRGLLAMHTGPRPGEVIVDVGCGTGSLALLLQRLEPAARIVGADGPSPEWRSRMGDALVEVLGESSADTVVSSLVLHQCPVAMKRAILASIHAVLWPGGKLVIADFGLERTRLMRLAFRIVQLADGKEDVQPNADDVLPKLMSEAGFTDVREAEVVSTLSGSISI